MALPTRFTAPTLDRSVRFKSTFQRVAQWYQQFWSPKIKSPPYHQHVCQIGDPVLRRPAELVPHEEINTEKITKVTKAMREVMKRYRSVGIAAPQIGIPLRIIMIEFDQELAARFPDEIRAARDMTVIPFKTFINPVIQVTDFRRAIFPEACESIKGLSACVPRYLGVNITGLDSTGNPTEWTATGWGARIVQHEMDHLEGRVYTDIMERQTFQVDNWQRINARDGDFHLIYNRE